MIKTSFTLDMYGCKIIIIIDSNIEAHYARLCKKFKFKYEEGSMEGAVISGDLDVYYLLFDSEHLNHNVIGHELLHLVYHIVKDRGIIDDEAMAWIAGHLNDKIYKLLEKKKLYPFNVR